MKDLKYEHQSIKVGGWWDGGGWVGVGFMGWVVVGCVVVCGGWMGVVKLNFMDRYGKLNIFC